MFLLQSITEVISEYKQMYSIKFTLACGDWNLTPDEWLDRCPSKYDDHYYSLVFKDFMNNNSFIDIWRINNPLLKQFTWIKPNGSSRFIIDLWLLSQEIVNFVTNVSISALDRSLCDQNTEARY